MNEQELTTVQPIGMLYSQGREYFLLHPAPFAPAEWQAPGTDRFLVVPRKKLTGDYEANETPATYYPPARHIVTNAYCIDYAWGDMPEIVLVKNVMLDMLEDISIDFWNSIMDDEESELKERLEDLQIHLPL